MAKSYKINAKEKTITIDDSVKMNATEKQDLQMYVGAGYIIKHKSSAKSKNAKERAMKNNFTDKQILEALKADKEAIEQYKAQKKEKGFFGAKSWYVKNYMNK